MLIINFRVGDDKLPKKIQNQNKHKLKRLNEGADINATKLMKTD